jgi:S-adenosylmethionine synthetase
VELTVGASRGLSADELEVEIVERMGLGHPDSICDALAEEFSISLSRFYFERFGLVLQRWTRPASTRRRTCATSWMWIRWIS